MRKDKAIPGARTAFFHRFRREIRFTVLFLSLLAVLNYIYYLLAGTPSEEFILTVITAHPAAFIINVLTPGEQLVVNGTLLTSKHVIFSVVSGCEGMGGILLIASAILALQLGWKAKLRGLLYGVSLLYALNVLRIVGLYYVMRHFSRVFDFAHFFLGQTIIIMVGCVFFALWISRNLPTASQEASASGL
jgi:exosortase family protein XrtM